MATPEVTAAQPRAAASFTILAGSMFDGLTVSGPSAVHVADGRVVAVADARGGVPGGGRVIDLGPETCLLPGLIDSHVHLAFDASPDPAGALIGADDAELLARMRAAAREALLAGITTVRDLGDRDFLSLALAAEFLQDPAQGPEILAAGPPITTPGGHCHFLGGEAAGTDALLAAVRERHARGCAVVKIMVSGGNMGSGVPPYESQFSPADLRTVVEEAHRLGLPVAAHVHGTASIRNALAAGADTLEHVSFMTAEGTDAPPDLLAAVAGSGAFVSLSNGRDPAAGTPVIAPAIGRRLESMLAAQRDLWAAGARIILGSDAGIAPFKPHDVLPHGVLALTQFGMSPLEALKSVTSRAALACRVDSRKGRIKPGADADFLAVHGDPLEDLARLRDVRAVFRAGTRVR